jgi:hypothetical protein
MQILKTLTLLESIDPGLEEKTNMIFKSKMTEQAQCS